MRGAFTSTLFTTSVSASVAVRLRFQTLAGIQTTMLASSERRPLKTATLPRRCLHVASEGDKCLENEVRFLREELNTRYCVLHYPGGDEEAMAEGMEEARGEPRYRRWFLASEGGSREQTT